MQPKYKIQPHHTIVIVDNDITVKYGNAIFKGGDLFFLNPTEDFDYSAIDFMETIIWRQDNIDWAAKLNTLELWQIPKTYNLLKSADADSVVGEMLQVRSEYKFVPTPAKKAPTPVLKAHGLVGMIADWITETAYRPQPQLSLGAALTFVGMLKGHKFSTSTDLRTNFLAMNIAPTGAGKDYPQNCVRRIITAVGLKQNRMARPTSGTGLLTGLQKANRVGLLTIDEVGRYLGNIANKNSGGWQREIVDYIIETFSLANSDFVGRQYANEKQNPTIELIQPHLCIIGSSVREKITESCRSSEIIDGFLNRWILFESKDIPPRNKNMEGKPDIPEKIITEIKRVIDSNPNGIYPLALDSEPIIKTIKYTPEAYKMIEAYADEIEELRKTSEQLLKALYVRSCEHVAKIALILCDNEFIREKDVELATQIVAESNRLIIDFAGLISDNDKHAEINRTMEIINKHKTIKRSSLVQKTRFLGSTRRLNEILDQLAQEGAIDIEKDGKDHIIHFRPTSH